MIRTDASCATTPCDEEIDSSMTTHRLHIEDIGRVDYSSAFELQQRIHAEVVSRDRPPTLLLLRRPPRVMPLPYPTRVGYDVAPAEILSQHGIEIRQTDRGGDVTYHGPGQLVAYPILRLDDFGLNLRRYIRMLERVIIDAVATFGVSAGRDVCAVGVWVDPEDVTRYPVPEETQGAGPCATPVNTAKLAAIGVRIRKWTTLHGLAINVTTNMDHFKLIVPCGLTRPVTSLGQLLGDRCPSMGDVKDAVSRSISNELREASATS